jgi:hypothetical protein
MNAEQIKEILAKHGLWINGDPNGSRANLTGANLTWADLSGADLTGANLTGANLTWADLSGANLSGANLTWADLSGANLSGANLTRANLTWADLSGANLSGANLTWADRSGANLTRAYIPKIDRLHSKILEAINAGGKLEMNTWHTCETTHCRAGWAICLAGESGKKLEESVGSSAAGALIFAASYPEQKVPDFYATNKDAMDDIERCAREESV